MSDEHATVDVEAARELERLTHAMLRARSVVDAGGGELAERAFAELLEQWLRYGARHPELMAALRAEMEAPAPSRLSANPVRVATLLGHMSGNQE